MKLSNWGNFPRIEADLKPFKSDWEKNWFEKSFISRGLGRSYGDASLYSRVLSMVDHSGVIDFDESGTLAVKAGTSLDEILKFIVPKGFFLPVTPGTKYVTIGGAIAADVHGKNHHKEGTISNFVSSLELFDGKEISPCSLELNPELFNWTCGGMGLTGVIQSVKLRLKKIETSLIRQNAIKAKDLESLLLAFDENQDWTYSVAWLDSLAKGKSFGRGILYLGEHAEKDEVKNGRDSIEMKKKFSLNIPFHLPGFILNPISNSLFNKAYFNLSSDKDFIDLDPFFYPLDRVKNWNRAYGSRGFVQYQFVIPENQGIKGVEKVILDLQKRGLSSFLTVLKKLGEGRGFLSFPIKGYTLALDFPARKKILKDLVEIDRVIHEMGGRVYLAKDARLESKYLSKGYERIDDFKQFIRGKRFESSLSKRLGIT